MKRQLIVSTTPPIRSLISKKHYYKVAKPVAYGDIIMLVNDQDIAGIHVAVYLADDIVFTKNGLTSRAHGC